MALLIKLVRIWDKRRESPKNCNLNGHLYQKLILVLFLEFWDEVNLQHLLGYYPVKKLSASKSNFPASILEKSRISLMISNKDSQAFWIFTK